MATNLKSVKAAALTSVINSVVSSGVKITGLTYIGSATAANPAGSETVTIAGSGFNSGAIVYIDITSCATTYVSATSLTFTSPAKSAGSYHLYVYNTDGSSGILPSGFVSSSLPVWVTASGALTGAPLNSAYSQSVDATGDSIVYSLTTGSLPTGLSLNSSTGAITGTATVEATSTFSITATDAQNQAVARSFSIAVNNPVSSVEYLLVAGGGGGGSDVDVGGGGGGGGLLTANSLVVSTGTVYAITVGGGGARGTGPDNTATGGGSNGSQGGSSSVFGLTAIGGGYGGTRNSSGGAGGSGGGGGDYGAGGGAGTAGQGFAGGTAPTINSNGGWDSGGGGGAGGAAVSFTPGPGLFSSIGNSTFSAGGRGAQLVSGAANTGNGGSSVRDGGSGVVIIRYADSYAAATSTTGSPTITVASGYRVYKFTASGTITF